MVLFAKNNILIIFLILLIAGFLGLTSISYGQSSQILTTDEIEILESLQSVIDIKALTDKQAEVLKKVNGLTKEQIVEMENPGLSELYKKAQELLQQILNPETLIRDIGTTKSVDIKISPPNPGPNSKVDISLLSYSFDINRSTITWVLNGKTLLKGIGEKIFSFTTGAIGSKSSLSITIVSQEGDKIYKELGFRPADLDILWEAETSVPEIYKGKSLPSSESKVRLTVLPNFIDSNGKGISPSKLIYNWEINHNYMPLISGYGRQSFVYKISEMNKEDDIRVTVSDYNKNIVVEKTIKIHPVFPKLLFYKESPLEGVQYNEALDRTDISENEIMIVAEPYFFSKEQIDNLSYLWKSSMDGGLESERTKNKMKIRFNPEEEYQSVNIDLDIKNDKNFFQYANNSLIINSIKNR